MKHGRRVHRQIVGWRGLCFIEDPSATIRWRECRVLDISSLGIGIICHDDDSDDLIGHAVSVVMRKTSESVTLRLRGHIRNTESFGDGMIRIGIEFLEDLSSAGPIADAISFLTSQGSKEPAQSVVEQPQHRQIADSPLYEGK